MPQPCNEHSEEYIHACPCQPVPVAAKWYVHVVAEPRGQGYMPPVPEFGGVQTLVWEVEVVVQLESYQCRQSYGYVAIAREIEEYL